MPPRLDTCFEYSTLDTGCRWVLWRQVRKFSCWILTVQRQVSELAEGLHIVGDGLIICFCCPVESDRKHDSFEFVWQGFSHHLRPGSSIEVHIPDPNGAGWRRLDELWQHQVTEHKLLSKTWEAAIGQLGTRRHWMGDAFTYHATLIIKEVRSCHMFFCSSLPYSVVDTLAF